MIDSKSYGVSFSLKQCRNFAIDPQLTLKWLLAQGWRRFRFMSYWDEHEKRPGTYDFTELDKQIRLVEKAGGIITLCLGVKQPRWPEYHWPEWALHVHPNERDDGLLRYVAAVVNRYKHSLTITSWQLENEALLRGFGQNIIINRKRLRAEYRKVRQLDPGRPIAMSTSNGWGIPLRSPRPSRVGFSYYPIMYKNGAYHRTIQKPWLHRLRKLLIRQPVFIHELQCEPWGPTAIWEMSEAEQDKSMSLIQIRRNFQNAKSIGVHPIDLWGGEWWYWRSLQGDNTVWQAVRESLS